MEAKSLPPPAVQKRTSLGRLASRFSKLTKWLLCVLAALWLASSAGLLNPIVDAWSPHVKTNVIMMVSDGFGPASQTYTRAFYQALTNNTAYDAAYRLPLDTILVGTHRSRSSNSLITDSAAGATAFACAKKSYNGAIGVDADGKPCGTVFEAAKRNGLLTGVVVTTRLTDATPAAFISHAASRAEEPLIASQLIGGDKNPLGERTLDLAIGGGGCNFLPKSSPLSCRLDDEDTVKVAQDLGWNVRLGFSPEPKADGYNSSYAARAMFEGLREEVPSLPLLALLAPGNTPFDIDRLSVPASVRPPSLADMASKALKLLSSSPKNHKGFIVMIEGSQIDLCAHNNDPACHAREALAYQDTISVVKRFVERHNNWRERTVLISTSDHETGGVTLGRQLTEGYPNYAYYPNRLLDAKHSAPVLSAVLLDFVRDQQRRGALDDKVVLDFILQKILGKDGLGFVSEKQGGPATEEEGHKVLDAVKAELGISHFDEAAAAAAATAAAVYEDVHPADYRAKSPVPPTGVNKVRKAIADVSARRAEIGFSTEGHTGVDINVYAYGWNARKLAGNQENTDIGKFIAKSLNLDLDAITKELNRHSKA
ncbi:vacuolar alkaline phosphatase [Thecaphora frezii]